MGSSQSVSTAPSGYRILSVIRDSPAHYAGLEPYFDHIVEVNRECFTEDNVSQFGAFIREFQDKAVKFVIFNSRNRVFRDIWITPNEWSKEYPTLLGVTMKFVSNVLDTPTSVRILSAQPQSPAEKAGLQPLKDYLLGTDEREFSSVNDLLMEMAYHLKNKADQPLKIQVYNSTSEVLRAVHIQLDPNDNRLGCDIGEGIIHQIPPPRMNAHRNAYSRYLHHGQDSNSEIYIQTEPIPSLPLSPPKNTKPKLEQETSEQPPPLIPTNSQTQDQ